VKPSPVRTSADLHLSHSWLCSKAYEGLCKLSHLSSPLVPSPLGVFKVESWLVRSMSLFSLRLILIWRCVSFQCYSAVLSVITKAGSLAARTQQLPFFEASFGEASLVHLGHEQGPPFLFTGRVFLLLRIVASSSTSSVFGLHLS
jgi:hypothetical protein